MTTSKHSKTEGESPFTSDLERNPGIGQSKGAFAMGGKPQDIKGDNTIEGDVENDPDASGGVPEEHLGRTNN